MKKARKLLPLFVAICMLMTLFPSGAFASDGVYNDAYANIDSASYEAYNQEFYTNGINFTSNGDDAFMYGEDAWVSYLVDFADKNANTLVMNMRPNVRNTQGSFGVYIDDLSSEPVLVFDQSKNIPYAGYTSYAGPGYSNYCFNLPEALTGKHTVYFKALSNAATFFNCFYFKSDVITDCYSKLKPSDNPLVWGTYKPVKEESDGEETTAVLPNIRGAAFIPGIDFGNDAEKGAAAVTVRYGRWDTATTGQGSYEVRLDSIDGKVIGVLNNADVKSGYGTYTIKFNTLLKGVHTLVFCMPVDSNISWVQPVEGTSEDLVETDGTASAYENYAVNLSDVFKSTDTKYSFEVDFGESDPEYLALSMRPALDDTADGGIIEVYIDDNDEPAASFTTYRSEVNMMRNGTGSRDSEWFAPIDLGGAFNGGVHTVTFKAASYARSNFNYFRFDKDVAAKDAYSTIKAADSDYIVHKGDTMWGGGNPVQFVYGFGMSGDPAYSAAFAKVDFGADASGKVIVRMNKRQEAEEGKVEVRLGSRYGEVIGTLNSADMTLGSSDSENVEYYAIELTKQLTGVQDIVFTSDFWTTFYSFTFDHQILPTDENTSYGFIDNVGTLTTDSGEYQTYSGGNIEAALFTKTAGAEYREIFKNVDFGDKLSTYGIKLNARTTGKGDGTAVLEIYVAEPDGTPGSEPVGRFAANDGINTANFADYPIELAGGVNGIKDVYIKWTGNWILNDFTCVKGCTSVFDSDNNGVIYAAASAIRSSTDINIQSNGNLDNGYTVAGIGKGGNVDSISFPGLDFGTEGVEKITLRMTRVSNSTEGTVRVLLGDRNGVELASKPLADISGAGTFSTYEFTNSTPITGIHMITITIDYECIVNYAAFNLEGSPITIDPATVLNGHENVSVLDYVQMDNGTFTSSNNGGNICVYAPVYTTGMAEGGSISFNLSVNNAKYVAVCAKSNNTQVSPVVSVSKSGTEIAELTIPQAYRNGTGYYMDVYTAELASPVTGTAQYSVTMKSGTANVAWIRFMTEEEYAAFQSRTKIALLGDSNVEYGKYTVALREMLDIDKYEIKSLGVSGRTVRNYSSLPEYQTALEYAPDIVIFTLGTNDAGNSCDDAYMEAFKADYTKMIEELRSANPDARIYLQYPLPFRTDVTEEHENYTTDKLLNRVIPAIDDAARLNDAEIIDIYNGVLDYGYDREELFGDDLHVNNAGGVVMAKLTKSAVFPNRVEITPASGAADEISIDIDSALLTSRGAKAKASANQDVYWVVENPDGSDCSYAEITQDGVITAVKPGVYNAVAVSKADTSKRASVRMENRFAYVISTDADLINSSSYAYRSLKNFREPFIAGYNDGTVIMLKNIDLTDVSAFIVRASSMYDTAPDPLEVECRLDSVNGEVIGRTIITKNAKDTKYAFSPYKNAIVPVGDGELHNLFFVLSRGTDTDGTVRAIDGVYAIELEYGAARNLAVYEDGILQDTMPIVNSDYDTTEKFTGYKAGHTYTWKTTTGGNDSGMLVMALHNADGVLVAADIAENAGGVYTAEITLPEDFDDTYTIKSIAMESLGTMVPVLKNPNVQNSDKITIGCVGDSITNNWNHDEYGIQEYCYPKFLQSMLGTEKYEVMNFGRGTSTASSYVSNPWFTRAKEAACDVYIIMLGTNDSKSSLYYNAIPTDYQAIIDGLKEANPDCKIYINLPIPAYSENFAIADTVIENNVIPLIKELAEKNGIETLDLHTMIEENPNMGAMYFSDGIHPNEYGQSFIAECIKDAYFAD